LNVGLRVERSIAVLSAMYANSKTKDGGFKFTDFVAHESQREVTLEEAMAAWA
jgi:hypothetical protein